MEIIEEKTSNEIDAIFETVKKSKNLPEWVKNYILEFKKAPTKCAELFSPEKGSSITNRPCKDCWHIVLSFEAVEPHNPLRFSKEKRIDVYIGVDNGYWKISAYIGNEKKEKYEIWENKFRVKKYGTWNPYASYTCSHAHTHFGRQMSEEERKEINLLFEREERRKKAKYEWLKQK